VVATLDRPLNGLVEDTVGAVASVSGDDSPPPPQPAKKRLPNKSKHPVRKTQGNLNDCAGHRGLSFACLVVWLVIGQSPVYVVISVHCYSNILPL